MTVASIFLKVPRTGLWRDSTTPQQSDEPYSDDVYDGASDTDDSNKMILQWIEQVALNN